MDLGCADTDLRAKAKLSPVAETCRSVYQHNRRINLSYETIGPGIITGDNGFRVIGTMRGDVLHSLVHIIHNPDRKNQVKVFFRPVGFFGLVYVWKNPARFRTTPHLYSGLLKTFFHAGQENPGCLAVDEKGLHGIANPRTLNLGIKTDRFRHVRV